MQLALMQPCRDQVGAEGHAMLLERQSPPHARTLASPREESVDTYVDERDQEPRPTRKVEGDLRPAKGPLMEIE